jgi:hypothetical protein
MKIVALDPGGTTGWASYAGARLDGFTLPVGRNGFNSGQIGPGEHHKTLYDFLCFEQTQEFYVVSESFEYRQNQQNQQRTTVDLSSKEYIGVAKYFVQERMRGGKLVEQTAGKVKPFWTDDKLKKLGLWNSGQKHANDAMRHLVHYMVFDLNGPYKTPILQKLR